MDDFSWRSNSHPELTDYGQLVGDIKSELRALRNHRYDSTLELEEGMLVILLATLDLKARLASGSIERIVRFEPMAQCTMHRANKDAKDGAKIKDTTSHE